MPFKLFSVGHQPYRASNADNTEQLSSSSLRCQSTLPPRAIKPDLVEPIVSAPLVQQILTPNDLVGSVFRQTQTAQASLHSVHASRPFAPSPYTPATTSLAFPVQPNSNIYTTAQPVSQPEMLTSHWRSHPHPQYVSNACMKLSSIQIPKFDGDPLAFHDWNNIFKASVHENTSISQAHWITYLQNSVSGKAKDLIRGYSCNPAFYKRCLGWTRISLWISTTHRQCLPTPPWKLDPHVIPEPSYTCFLLYIPKTTRSNIHQLQIHRRPSIVNSTHYC